MIKSDTTTMNNASDWSGVAPVIGEVGLFNNIISAVNEAALTLGGDITVGGLVFTYNLNGNVSVAALTLARRITALRSTTPSRWRRPKSGM